MKGKSVVDYTILLKKLDYGTDNKGWICFHDIG